MEIIKCPECSDIWVNQGYDGIVCECGNCKKKYYREDNRKIMDGWVYEAFRRVKG